MKKYFTDREYAKIIDKIMAMDLLVRSFNDEEWVFQWLAYGVPDGTQSREDYEDTYPNDITLEREYRSLTALFCRMVAAQTASIQMPVEGTDFQPRLKFNGDGIII
jgi:hypothetical protein